MSSTFQGLEIARGGVRAARSALNITGQNITNSGTTGYTRQRVNQSAIPAAGINMMYPYTAGTNTGCGVNVTSIEQLRNKFLDAQYRTQYAKSGDSSTRLSALQDIESALNESTTDGLNSAFSALITQLEGMTSTGKSTSTESTIKNAASNLASKFNTSADQIDTIWKQQYSNITTYGVDKVNTLLKSIAGLSDQIKNADIAGTPALELMDERNNYLDELSQYVSVKVTETPTDIGSGKTVDTLSVQLADKDGNAITDASGNVYTLVNGNQYSEMSVSKDKINEDGSAQASSDPYDAVHLRLSGLTKDGVNFNIESGKISTDSDGKLTKASNSIYTFQLNGGTAASVTLDGSIGETLSDVASDLQTQLDAAGYSGKVKVNVSEDGKQLIFQTSGGASLSISHTAGSSDLLGITDSNGRTSKSSTDSGMRNGDVKTGEFQGYLQLLNENGEYDTAAGGTTTSFRGLGYYRELLNTIASNFASVMNKQNSTNDTGDNKPLFTDSNGDTNDIDAANIRISSKWTTNYLVTSKDSSSAGDDSSNSNSNISSMITALKSTEYTLETPNSVKLFNGTIQESVSNIGLTVGQQIDGVNSDDTTNENMLDNIDSRRQAISSVDINDEAINLITYNQALTASARFMTTVDECLETIISNMGMAGRG